MQVKNVLFDFGKVLGTFDKPSACKHFAETSTYSAEDIYTIITGQLEKLLESGQMSETAFCNELLFRCKVEKLTVPDVMRIWGNIFGPNPAINPIVDQLIAKKIPIGVLSNTNGIHWPFIAALPVMRKLRAYGAPFTLSYEIGAFKPDEAMYRGALKALSAQAEETLYIDDIQEYVDAARAIGMQAAWYDCTKNPERIEQVMSSYGLL